MGVSLDKSRLLVEVNDSETQADITLAHSQPTTFTTTRNDRYPTTTLNSHSIPRKPHSPTTQLVNRLFSKSYLTPAHLTGERRDKLKSDFKEIIEGAKLDWVDKDVSVVSLVISRELHR